MAYYDDPPAIVIDCGSSCLLAGIAGDDSPSSIVPSCIGTPKYPPVMIDQNHKLGYIGEETVSSRRGILNFHYPIQNGIVKNWDLMEILLDYTFFKELKLDETKLKNHNIVYAEPILQPHSNSQKLLEYSFEKYEMNSVFCEAQPILSVYASGRGSALSVCFGEGVLQIVPVMDGYSFPDSMKRVHFGGSNITDYMIHLLWENHGMDFSKNRFLVEEMIRKVGYTTLDYESDLITGQNSSLLNESYQLPDGQVLTLSNERFLCSEILFNPSIVKNCQIPTTTGIADLFYECIQSSDIDNRNDLYGNLVISGGPSLFSGIAKRINKEMTARAPPERRVRVVAPPERKISVWIGGSILASLSSFSYMWISKEDYEDMGAAAVNRKCYLY